MRVGIEPRQEHWSVCGVYTEVQVRYRIILPILFGSLAIALVIWDIHNLRVIQSNGMSWDTGAPIWPYEAANLIFSSLNAPAFVLAAPFFYFPHLELQEMRYPVLLPAIVVWWWWIGTRFDFGILGLRRWSHPRWWRLARSPSRLSFRLLERGASKTELSAGLDSPTLTP